MSSDMPPLEKLIWLWLHGIDARTLAARYWVSYGTAKRWLRMVEQEVAKDATSSTRETEGGQS